MKIEFPERQAKNDKGGMNFPVVIDDNEITFEVTDCALQDIAPENATDSVEKQFNDNRGSFENIAEERINNNNSNTVITHIDVAKFNNK